MRNSPNSPGVRGMPLVPHGRMDLASGTAPGWTRKGSRRSLVGRRVCCFRWVENLEMASRAGVSARVQASEAVTAWSASLSLPS